MTSRNEHAALLLVLLGLAVVTSIAETSAQRRTTPTQTLQAAAQRAVEDQVVRRLGDAIGVGAPLRLDQHDTYPPVAASLSDFSPTTWELEPADITKPLMPGDYSLSVLGFCTQWSLHLPGQGLGYKLGRIEGRDARAIGVLLTRGVEQAVPPRQLNAAAWRIQGGVPPESWPPRDRALADKLISEYSRELNTDYVWEVVAGYAQARSVAALPPFPTLLARLGPAGEAVLEARRARSVLSNKTLAIERMPDYLYQRDRLPRTLTPPPGEPPSPWSEIQPGVFARLTIVRGNMGINTLDLRVTPRAVARVESPTIAFVAMSPRLVSNNVSAVTLGGVLGWLGHLGDEYLNPLIGYPIGHPAQALILVPAYPHLGIRG
ncbi:MAG: hypothetical protein U0Q11_27000 [Vicinamibacterales bacterium]